MFGLKGIRSQITTWNVIGSIFIIAYFLTIVMGVVYAIQYLLASRKHAEQATRSALLKKMHMWFIPLYVTLFLILMSLGGPSAGATYIALN
jgi:membrane protein insertase Oxa1/YidC/SpoIIIJ